MTVTLLEDQYTFLIVSHQLLKLDKTLIRMLVTYGAETWTMTKKEEQALLIIERKMFRRIYGPKYEDGEWRTRRVE